MKTQAERDQWYGHLSDLVRNVKIFIKEFELIENDNYIKKTLPFSGFVYTSVIVITLGKIFSTSKNEHFRLNRIQDILESDINGIPELQAKVQFLLTEHSDFINVINTNRDMAYAHLDKDLSKLLFSEHSVKYLEEKYKANYSKLRALPNSELRYTQVDLVQDLPKIKLILENIDDLWHEIFLLDYTDKDLGLS